MNEIVFVNKKKNMTSFDVCNKIRKALKLKKVGHTGTLDPNATGLMILLFDNATKVNQFLVDDKKEYIATVKLGIKTDSLDIDGNILEENDDKLENEDLNEILKSFIGKQKQLPPMLSAIKVDGKKLYEYYREGKEVDIKERDIEIFEIELLEKNIDSFTFRCLVSKGTYIRVLVQDILNKINKIGTLLELNRTKIDEFDIKDANEIEDIINNNYKSFTVYDILSKRYEIYECDDKKYILDGKSLKIDSDAEKILVVYNKEALAIYYKEKDSTYRCLRGLL